MEFSLRTTGCILGLFLITILVNTVTNFKFGIIKDTPSQASKSYVSIENVDRTLDCLAMNIYREAGGESFEGKVAIAQVTLNRVDHPGFPKDICAVVYQKNIFMEKVVCQFSWYCEGHSAIKPQNKVYQESYAVAKKVLLEGFRLDILKDALYFHAVYVNPSWKYTKVGKIGNHIFYKGNAT